MMQCASAHELHTAPDVLRPGGLALTDEALLHCSLPAFARVLDVGCGTGAVVAHLRNRYGYRAIGIDAAAAGGCSVQALASYLPVKDAAVHCVLAECVLSLVPDAVQAVREMQRVLVPGGWAVISDIYDKSQPGSMQELVRSCGFTVELWQDHSRSLREFAALRVLQGRSGDLCLPAGLHPAQAAYFLIIARKDYLHG